MGTRQRGAAAGLVLGVVAGVVGCGRSAPPPTTLAGPPTGPPLDFRQGRPLARWVAQSGILVTPARLAPWARTALARLGGPVPRAGPALWAPDPARREWVAAWATPGVRIVPVPVLRAAPGVPPPLLHLLERALPMERPAVTVEAGPEGRGRPAWSSPRPVVTTADDRLQRVLAASLPRGAAALVVASSGAVLAAAAGAGAPPPSAPGPVGSALEPVLLAEALGPWWTGTLPDPSVTAGLAMRAGRWSTPDVLAAYRRLGLAARPLPGVATVPLPAAPAVSPASLLFHGQGVWASPLAVARAWASLEDGGRLPTLEVVAGRRDAPGPLLASREAAAAVRRLLPATSAGNPFWFAGPSAPAVALLQSPPYGRAVLVVLGLPDARSLAALAARLTRGGTEERTAWKAKHIPR